MAFLEWRKFNFFDLKDNFDEGIIAEALKESDVTTITSGNSYLVIGDSMGFIYLFSRTWDLLKFLAYDSKVCLAELVEHSSILVTVGDNEVSQFSILKVWDIHLKNKNGVPMCVRQHTLSLPVKQGTKTPTVSALTVQNNLTAVGFSDGTVILIRGDIRRDRGCKERVINDSSSPITGLAFRVTGAHTHLFVSTTSSIIAYDVTSKDKEEKTNLDNEGCNRMCSVLSKGDPNTHFIVGRSDAIYYYTTDARGPCYGIVGEKVLLTWFRTYLIIVIAVSSKDESGTPVINHVLTVLDIQNKFIVYTTRLKKVLGVFNEWGACYVLDGEKKLHHLDEKDLDTKLSLLFKKNLYDVAIRTAKSQQYDSDGLMDIFRLYGDHLYSKGDHAGAIEQYVKTIGKLEPSYVIRKFLDSQHIEKLATYLEAMHKQKKASEEHTTLLLNCYTKLNQSNQLETFLLAKDREIDFDVEIAIKVCRQFSPNVALVLAEKHQKHEWYLVLQIEDNSNHSDALDYISKLEFEDAEYFMKKYGAVLVENEPDKSTKLLQRLCTDYKPNNDQVDVMDSSIHFAGRSDPENFIHLLVHNSEKMVDFLEYLINEGRILTSLAYDTLLDHYLYIWACSTNSATKETCSQKIIKLMQNPDTKYDKNNALVLCHFHNFHDGILFLYEEEKMYLDILNYYIEIGAGPQILATCTKFGHQDPTLWIHTLWACIKDSRIPKDVLLEVLSVIAKEKLLSPLMVMDAVKNSTDTITVGDAREYLRRELKNELDLISSDTRLVENYQADTESTRKQIQVLRSETVVFQGSRCAACHQQLELPSIHFLCQHSFHQHCFQSYSDSDTECPVCLNDNKSQIEMIKARDIDRDLHETFHKHLERAADGFSLTAKYFGRGVFNQPKIILEEKKRSVSSIRNPSPVETNVRISSSPVRIDTNSLTNLAEYLKNSSVNSKQHIRVDDDAKNPFEDNSDTKNPFEVGETSRNPFEEDDYDNSLNPFE